MAEPYLPGTQDPPKSSGWRTRLLSPSSAAPTWVGLALTIIGFGLLAFAWGKVAGLTNVALQVPYLVSAGFSGLGLIAVGCTVVSLQARRQDAAARDSRLAALAEVLEVLERVASDDLAPAPESSRAVGPRTPRRSNSRTPVKARASSSRTSNTRT